MPAWQDLRPQAMAAHLSIVWSYRYDRVSRSFTGRLAGDKIARLFGKNFRGIPLHRGARARSDRDHPCGPEPRRPRAGALHRGWGKVLKQLDQFGIGERIMLPLGSDGMNADEVLGATDYRLPQLVPGIPVQSISECEQWFSLHS